MSHPIYSRRRLIYLGEDDGSGLLFFPTVFHYMSEAEQLFWDSYGYPITSQIEDGYAAPAVHASCDYKKATKAGDALRQEVRMTPGSDTSYRVEHSFFDDGGQLALSGTMVRVFVDLGSMTPKAIPGLFFEAISAGKEAKGPRGQETE